MSAAVWIAIAEGVSILTLVSLLLKSRERLRMARELLLAEGRSVEELELRCKRLEESKRALRQDLDRSCRCPRCGRYVLPN